MSTTAPAIDSSCTGCVKMPRLTIRVVAPGFDDLSWIPHAGQATGLIVNPSGGVRRWLDGIEVTVEAPRSPAEPRATNSH